MIVVSPNAVSRLYAGYSGELSALRLRYYLIINNMSQLVAYGGTMDVGAVDGTSVATGR